MHYLKCQPLQISIDEISLHIFYSLLILYAMYTSAPSDIFSKCKLEWFIMIISRGEIPIKFLRGIFNLPLYEGEKRWHLIFSLEAYIINKYLGETNYDIWSIMLMTIDIDRGRRCNQCGRKGRKPLHTQHGCIELYLKSPLDEANITLGWLWRILSQKIIYSGRGSIYAQAAFITWAFGRRARCLHGGFFLWGWTRAG